MITKDYMRIAGGFHMAEGIFTVRIDPEKQQRIDQLAQQLDRSRNYICLLYTSRCV